MLSISILAPNWHEMVLFYSIYQTKTSKHAQSPRTTACNFHVTLLKNLHQVRNVKDARVADVCMQANAFFKLACDVDQNRQGARQQKEGMSVKRVKRKGRKKALMVLALVCVSERRQRVGKSN